MSYETKAEVIAKRPDEGLVWSVLCLLVLPSAAWWITRETPAWVTMWAVSSTEFFALKLLTMSGFWKTAPFGRSFAYLTLWPGMNTASFLGAGSVPPKPSILELIFGVGKLLLGLAALLWALVSVDTAPAMLVGWVGMFGLIFTLHFGTFHLVSWTWRQGGVNAPPIMRNPLGATSLADFWGARWNVAFADASRRFLVRPLARSWGVRSAGAFVFFFSGLVHETVISLPAQGGWGGPTLYFVIQGFGAWLEKTSIGKRLGMGSGWRGWIGTMLVTALPLPFLFHEPFVLRIMVPFFQFLTSLIHGT